MPIVKQIIYFFESCILQVYFILLKYLSLILFLYGLCKENNTLAPHHPLSTGLHTDNNFSNSSCSSLTSLKILSVDDNSLQFSILNLSKYFKS